MESRRSKKKSTTSLQNDIYRIKESRRKEKLKEARRIKNSERLDKKKDKDKKKLKIVHLLIEQYSEYTRFMLGIIESDPKIKKICEKRNKIALNFDSALNGYIVTLLYNFYKTGNHDLDLLIYKFFSSKYVRINPMALTPLPNMIIKKYNEKTINKIMMRFNLMNSLPYLVRELYQGSENIVLNINNSNMICRIDNPLSRDGGKLNLPHSINFISKDDAIGFIRTYFEEKNL